MFVVFLSATAFLMCNTALWCVIGAEYVYTADLCVRCDM